MLTMDASGRLVIPKEIRRLLHLSAGAELRSAVVGNRLELTPVEPVGTKPRRRPASWWCPAAVSRLTPSPRSPRRGNRACEGVLQHLRAPRAMVEDESGHKAALTH